MKNISIFAKVIVSYSILLMLILFIGAYNYDQLNKTVESYDNLLRDSTVIDDVRTMQVDFKKQVQEWKNILIRGHVQADFSKYHGRFLNQYDLVRERGAVLLKYPLPTSDLAILRQFLKAHQQLQSEYVEGVALFAASGYSDYQSTDRLVRGKDRSPTDLLDKLNDNILHHIKLERVAIQVETARVKVIAVSVLIITLLLASLLSIFLALTISRLYAKQERIAVSLSKYLSPQIHKFIFSGERKVKVETHRKNLTVFFSDIQGFTQLTDTVEPETLTTLLNEYFNEMSTIALRYGGTIDKFMGDAIMIFYGDPESKGCKQDALDCLLMALEMRECMKGLREKWQTEGIYEPLQIRAGVNSGYCTVGNFGSEDRLDYTIIGGTVNLASRLESVAAPNDIIISHQTYALVKDIIYCEKRSKIQVKGIAHPVQTYRVVDIHEKVRKAHAELKDDLHKVLEKIYPFELSDDERSQIGKILEDKRDKLKVDV
ncbi:MAG: adenylate/guanylate cyclase domain-containing protein [Psychrosphaera sp.]|nr:adenylate/guanylate cyclase domain-containing protein [Psychrosphaera sp.]